MAVKYCTTYTESTEQQRPAGAGKKEEEEKRNLV
jgi:hypothetical protein